MESYNWEFNNQKFTITEDIYFSVDTVNINGNIICDIKTLKLHYYESFYNYNSAIINKKITGIQESIKLVELMNTLNRINNHGNLYEIYKSKINFDDSTEQILNLFKKNDMTKYKDELIRERYRFTTSKITESRNPKFPLWSDSIDEITYVPIYSRIKFVYSSKLLIHIVLLLCILSNMISTPDINIKTVSPLITQLMSQEKPKDSPEVSIENNDISEDPRLINEIGNLSNSISNINYSIDKLDAAYKNYLTYYDSETNKSNQTLWIVKSENLNKLSFITHPDLKTSDQIIELKIINEDNRDVELLQIKKIYNDSEIIYEHKNINLKHLKTFIDSNEKISHLNDSQYVINTLEINKFIDTLKKYLLEKESLIELLKSINKFIEKSRSLIFQNSYPSLTNIEKLIINKNDKLTDSIKDLSQELFVYNMFKK